MEGSVGDTIVVESERVDTPARTGVIEHVLQQEPPRYEVRWEDGHTSIFSSSAGATERRVIDGRLRAASVRLSIL
ncbi:MAG: DUF1918 domain-containing protein [Gaiellaceae bacterium]